MSWIIRRLRLVNYQFLVKQGIDDFEIDRYGSDNNIITIMGPNGSGKTFLITEMTPRAFEAIENRTKSRIVEGKDGIKEIDIENEDTGMLYKGIINYPSKGNTTCSLVKVDLSTGEEIELNPSGKLTTYNSILASPEMGLSKNYTNVGYLSPALTNLIQMKPTPRYEYISTWLPDIKSYLDAYKNVMKKVNLVNKQINMINKDIGEMTTTDIVQKQKILVARMKELDKSIEDTQEEYTKQSVISDTLFDCDTLFIKKKLSINTANANKLREEKEKLDFITRNMESYTGEDGKNKLEKDILNAVHEIDKIQSLIISRNEQMETLKIRISDMQTSIGDVDIQSLPDITQSVKNLEDKINDRSKILTSMLNTDKNFYDEISEELNEVSIKALENLFESLRDKYMKITTLVKDEVLDMGLENYSKILETRMNNHLNNIEKESQNINSISAKISSLKNSGLSDNIMELKPTHDMCNAQQCGLIREIEKMLSPESEIDKLEIDLSTHINLKHKHERDLAELREESGNLNVVISMFQDINHAIYRDKDYISYLPTRISAVMSQSIPDILKMLGGIYEDFHSVNEYVSVRNNILVMTETLLELQEKEKIIKVKCSVHEDLSKTILKLDEIKNKQKEFNIELDDLNNYVVKLREIESSLSSINLRQTIFQNALTQHQSDVDKMREIIEDWYWKTNLDKALANVKYKIENLKLEREKLKKEYEELNTLIITKEALEKKREEYIKAKDMATELMDAWNPKTGIPSLFINSFLEGVKIKSNEYLEKLYGDGFTIEEFSIKDKSFPILIRQPDGTIVEDASECSEGEKSTLALSTSMAIMFQGLNGKDYNVIRIDEMDAMLDVNRRKFFIELIKDRMEDLNCKTCVLVSHNNEIENIEADMILFPGTVVDPDLLSNKTILFQG